MSTAAISGSNSYGQELTKGSADLGKDDFLKLLVVQFQYQDPLNPMEDKEFIAQLAQFSSLEQLMNLNGSMQGLTAATYEQQMLNATSFIGKNVIARGNQVSKEDGLAPTIYQYRLNENMIEGDIQVFDDDRNVIYVEILGPKTTGKTHKFEWNGKNMKGQEAPDGVYTVIMSARNADGMPIFTDSQVEGTIESVASESDGLKLIYNDGRWIYLSEVHQVSNVKKEEDDVIDPVDKELEDIYDTAVAYTNAAIKSMEVGVYTMVETQERVGSHLKVAGIAVADWEAVELDDTNYTKLQIEAMIENQHERLKALYDSIASHTFIDKDLAAINTKVGEDTADAIKDMNDGTITKAEAKTLVEAKIRVAATEVGAWTDQAVVDGTYTDEEVKVMITQLHKNFTAHYNSIDEQDKTETTT